MNVIPYVPAHGEWALSHMFLHIVNECYCLCSCTWWMAVILRMVSECYPAHGEWMLSCMFLHMVNERYPTCFCTYQMNVIAYVPAHGEWLSSCAWWVNAILHMVSECYPAHVELILSCMFLHMVNECYPAHGEWMLSRSIGKVTSFCFWKCTNDAWI